MNRKERRAAAKRGKAPGHFASGRAASPSDDLMAEARRFYQHGLSVQAEAVCNRILAGSPAHVPALNLLGVIAQGSGRHKLAAKMLARAIAEDELNSACHYNLASSYQALHQGEQAAVHFKRAIALGMSEKNVEDFILQSAAIVKCIERIEQAWPLPAKNDDLFDAVTVAAIANDVFLRCALESIVIRGVSLEKFLTQLRATLLRLVSEPEEPAGATTILTCALAQQCFINEYVFAQSDDETKRAGALKDLLLQRLANGDDIALPLLAAVATYHPLHAIARSEGLLDRKWPEFVEDLLRQQVREPLEEFKDLAAIPKLTPVNDAVSLQVMRQYGENPYPRWTNNPLAVLAGDNERIEGFELDQRRNAIKDILIVGCGTGRHAFQVAQLHPAAQVLAVDISLPSLAFARRKTREQGLRNVDYAQADILNIGALGRSFDRIEAVGVLHHLAEPEAAWHALLALLRPTGEMRVGLYSETARRAIVEARALIAGREYRPTPGDIRTCRQEILRDKDEKRWARITSSADFYSMSGCRDLLFNVMEHRFTLPRIADFLAKNGLTFLGFDLDPQVVEKFQAQYTDAAALTDIGCWYAFEQANPLAFRHMYVFSVCKA